MIEITKTIYEIVVWFFLLYSLTILGIYAWIAIYAYGALTRYRHKNLFTDYNLIVTNPNAPKFSLVAPAYNEGLTIVENVRSLLSLYYQNLEIIIVNDGSKDNSIQQLIEAYQLVATSFFVQGNLETKPIKAIYRSKNPAFKKLIVVDKENGGKADALNVGINVSTGDYLVCIDVDCILEQDAILKLAKPFLEQTDKRIIACGGVIRLANNCEVKDGKITEVRLPTSWLGRCQALEYIRAFVLGRMAWSRASGLILISGAFGAFDKEILLACGGYDSKTVGEDMELVVRMRRYMEETKQAYEVVNIPDPLCWTEVPESKEILHKQRNRWMRGTIETLWKHRKMMFNPQYGKLGMISLPYWFLFEFLGPIIEYVGYIVFVIFLLAGIINWQFFFALFALVIASGILYSIFAVLVDLMSHQVYTKKVDLSKLLTAAIIEPFYFHPFIVKSSVKGVRDYILNQNGWGEMKRQGFTNQNKQNLSLLERIYYNIKQSLSNYTWPAVTFLLTALVTTFIEYKWYKTELKDLSNQPILTHLLSNNLDYSIQAIAVVGILYVVAQWLLPRQSSWLLTASFTVLSLLHLALIQYYSESRNLLGADAFIYGTDEMIYTLETSGMLKFSTISLCILAVSLVYSLFYFCNRKPFQSPAISYGFIALGIVAFFITPNRWFSTENEAVQNAVTGKTAYFLESNMNHWLETHPIDIPFLTQESVLINTDYPFLRDETTVDFLGSYFEKSTTPPHLVVLIVEGLGYAYSSDNGYVGNFTPFLDSLTKHSLYWQSTISSSGRTFAVLPSLLGSLPFGQSGFIDMVPQPNNFNLMNVLQKNQFDVKFFYGGRAKFDNMASFINSNEGVQIIEQSDFEETYRKLPEKNGESWGYDDQSLFHKMLTMSSDTTQPSLKIALTLSTHNPFVINDVEHFEKLFHRHLTQLNLPPNKQKWALDNKKALVSVINFDTALREFMEAYSKRADFRNTIFVITGDHAMPEIPLQEKIDRYHVPLVIYSPLLKTPKTFKHTVSHFDVTPSLLAFYRENYQLKTPTQVAWVGSNLGTTSDLGYPMMQSKNQLNSFLYKNYHIVDGILHELSPQLSGEAVENASMKKRVEQHFVQFKEKNKYFYTTGQLLPDSVYQKFMR